MGAERMSSGIVIPAQAGIQNHLPRNGSPRQRVWIPAAAGMTELAR